jgi:hypothetical protein
MHWYDEIRQYLMTEPFADRQWMNAAMPSPDTSTG